MFRPCAVWLAVLVAFGASLSAQSAAPAAVDGGSAEDVHAIRVALERIASLLEQQGERSRSLEALYRRIELSYAETAPLEDEARSLRSSLRFSAPDLEASEEDLAETRRELELGTPQSEEATAEAQMHVRQLERSIARRKRVQAMAQSRLTELEAELAAAGAERESWKRFLDQELARRSR
jgi:hypothetical protein